MVQSRDQLAAALKGESELTIRILAALVGEDARSPEQVAISEGVEVCVVYDRRRRFEKKHGVTLPRMSSVGRPCKITPTIGIPADGYSLRMVG